MAPNLDKNTPNAAQVKALVDGASKRVDDMLKAKEGELGC